MFIFSFVLSLIALLLRATLFPSLPILAFAPVIALAALRLSLLKSLWLSALCGALIDLLSDDPIGLHALNYTLIAGLLYRFRKHFLHDQPLHLSVFTALISSSSTLLQLFLLFLFDRRVPFDGKWIFADLIGMPIIDAVYAFVWFAAPLALFEKLHRYWMLFWLKRKTLSPPSH
jgi:rod shape-determining protein MreD